jgi:hypothetical protein
VKTASKRPLHLTLAASPVTIAGGLCARIDRVTEHP